MHTQGHAVINCAVLRKFGYRQEFWPILCGAGLPDFMIVLFALVYRYVYHETWHSIWSEQYFQTGFWQSLIDVFHSFPIAGVGLSVAFVARSSAWQAFFWSVFFHSLLDLPFHQADAHRHLFPLSDWRFVSPISYWDPDGHAAWVVPLEILFAGLSSLALWRQTNGLGRATLVVSIALYVPGALFVLRS